MTSETIQAAILQMQANLLSAIGQMKDMARRPTQPDDVNKLMSMSLQVGQLESGIQSLQTLSGALQDIGQSSLVATAVEVQEEEEPEEESQLEEGVITDAQIEAARIRPTVSPERDLE